jgi:HEAT repeat protein
MTRTLAGILALALSAFAGEDHAAAVKALGGPGAAARAEAFESLRGAGEPALPALLEGLRGGNVLVAAGCAELIGAGGFQAGRDALVEVLDRPESPRFARRACILALGRVGDGRDVGRLVRLAGEYGEAGLSLATLGETAALLPLRAVVAEPGAPPEAAFALAVLGDPAGVPLLLAALDGPQALPALRCLRLFAGRDVGRSRSDWDAWWRLRALAEGLGSAAYDASEEALRAAVADPGAAGDLLRIATDPAFPRDARTKALLALGLRRERSAAPALTRLLESDGDGMVRLYAAEALGRIGLAGSAVDLARYLIFDEEPFRKETAKGLTTPYYAIDCEVAKALVRLGVKGGLHALIRFLGEEHRVRVYHEALRALMAATGRPADYRPDGLRDDRREAAERWRRWFDENREGLALADGADFSDPAFTERVERLVDTLDHAHFLSMSRARETLTVLGESALPALRAGLARRALHVRVHCAEILGRIHAHSCRPDLAAAMRDNRPEVRSAAAAALATMGPGAEARAVLSGLDDPSADVRVECLRALARVPAKSALPAIRQAMAKPENSAADFVRESLFARAAHGDAGAMEELLALLGRPDAAFRQTVAERVRLLSGRDPGTTTESLSEWRRWREGNGGGHVPCFPFGSDG